MSEKRDPVLIIDDDLDVLHTARVVLKPYFQKIETESNPAQINYLIHNREYGVILLDMNYTAGATSGKEGLYWLKRIMAAKPDQQVVMMTAYGDLKLAVEAMKEGAADFVVKPWENEKFQATILAAYNHSQSKKELSHLRNKQNKMQEIFKEGTDNIIGASETMKNIFNAIEKVAATDANVLLLGENGTGKELLAKALHHQSARAQEVFVKVDLGAISESLFESELFGHKKGAFTDAKEERTGRFALADGGTLFLDEIGNLSLAMQSKLLTALQSKTITPVGGDNPVHVDCRIIAATNENLHERVAAKQFREDLLYRINTVELIVPPLRKRKEDIMPLANYFLNIYNQRYRKNLSISNAALDYLSSYQWPGNVREMQHAIERAVIMADDDMLEPSDFLLNTPQTHSKSDSLKLDEVEKQTIEEAIRKYKGNMSKAAKELGLGRTTLYRKIEKYGIK